MEASKADILNESGSVRAIDNRLVIEELVIEDERTARVVREQADHGCEPTATVRGAVEIGVRLIEREGTAAEADYVKAEFSRHAGELGERLGKMVEAGNDQLAEEIAKSFGHDRTGTVQHQIKEMLDRSVEAQRESLVKQFSAEDGTNPLFDFKDGVLRALQESRKSHRHDQEENRKRIEALTKEIIALKERGNADERVAEAEEAGTRKGLTFEELVHGAISQIASARGDAITHTGLEQAEGGGKKGDTLVELGGADGPPTGRILFEAKDRKLSKNQAWSELNEGMAARAASFAVLVVAGEDRVPAGRNPLTEYEGNKMIVAVERDEPSGIALEVAYRLAAARTMMARDSALDVDAAAVRDAAEEAVSTLKQAQSIRSNLTGIKTSADKARAGLDGLVEAIRAKLERIEALIGEADTSD
jgi:uncharacterized coiled-coil DUF342 family protein